MSFLGGVDTSYPLLLFYVKSQGIILLQVASFTTDGGGFTLWIQAVY